MRKPTALLAAIATVALTLSASGAAAQVEPDFGTSSPAYAAVRWLWFLSVIGVIGAVAFRFLVLGTARGLSAATVRDATARAAHVGFVSAAFALAAAGLRLIAQSIALLGEIGPDVAVLITSTTWGTAWIIHTAAATAAFAAFALAARELPAAWALAALTVLPLAAAPGLAGHAAAMTYLQPIPVVADALHVAAAGAWVGGLLVLLTAGFPAAHSNGPPAEQTAALVNAFSPLALASAAIIVATGAFAALMHLDALTDLFTTPWGRLLAAKLLAAMAVVAFGSWNFLRLKPRLTEPRAGQRLLWSAAAEITAGAVLLFITAFLVATPPPSEDDHDMTTSAIVENSDRLR